MIAWVQLDSAPIPGGGELRLLQRGAEFSIMSSSPGMGRTELMNSRRGASEADLATLAWAGIAPRKAPRILIGGLGMGFTLRAALEVAPRDAKVVVAELLPEVIAWAHGPLAHLFDGSLTDPRTQVIATDVIRLIAAAADEPFDAILLDVDNGPGGLNRGANDRIYSADGLAAARAALTARGVLAIWSAARDDAFVQRLRRGGWAVEEKTVRATPSGKGPRHIIWLAKAR